MIRTDYNAGNVNQANHEDLKQSTPAAKQPTVATEHEAFAPGSNLFTSSAQRTPSRMGETSAGTNMMKAQLLKATSAPQTDSLFGSRPNADIKTFTPASGDNGKPHTIYINGIETPGFLADHEAQAIANAGGATVDHIYQHSHIATVAFQEAIQLATRIAVLGPFAGTASTIAQARADLFKRLENPEAATAASKQIIAQLGSPDSKAEVRLMGYSQGAAISSQALKMVQKDLTNRYGKATADQMLSRVHVMTLGGAAKRTDFPPTIELTQMYHKHDLVSQFFGDNKTPLLGDVLRGAGIGPHLTYYSDPKSLQTISDWQNGRISNQNIALND